MNITKQHIVLALNEPKRAQGKARIFGYLLLCLISLNVIVLFLAALPLTALTTAILQLFSSFCTGIFLIEYGLRIWSAPVTRRAKKQQNPRLHYLLSPLGLIDFLSVASGFFLIFVQSPSMFCVVALLRLIKVARYSRGLRTIRLVIYERKEEIIAAIMLLLLLAIASSVAMYEAEKTAQPQVFTSVFSGLYWAMTTITTTGYGDMVPVTALGRLIGFITMILAIGVIAVPAGIFSAGFVEAFRKYKQYEKTPTEELLHHIQAEDASLEESSQISEEERSSAPNGVQSSKEVLHTKETLHTKA